MIDYTKLSEFEQNKVLGDDNPRTPEYEKYLYDLAMEFDKELFGDKDK